MYTSSTRINGRKFYSEQFKIGRILIVNNIDMDYTLSVNIKLKGDYT